MPGWAGNINRKSCEFQNATEISTMSGGATKTKKKGIRQVATPFAVESGSSGVWP